MLPIRGSDAFEIGAAVSSEDDDFRMDEDTGASLAHPDHRRPGIRFRPADEWL
jgi:hypothetical protein